MEEHHVFAAFSGFGLRVIPRAPHRVRLGPSARELDVEHEASEGELFARVVADGEGGYQSKLDSLTPSLHDVLDVEGGPELEAWHLDLGAFLVPLPEGFAAHSVPASSPTPFDLLGPGDALLYVQMPPERPKLRAIVSLGQEVEARGADWIDLTHALGGQRWWQRHHLAEVSGLQLAFTAQALSDDREQALGALESVVRGLIAG